MHQLTPYHAQYFAYELTRQHPSGDLGKLAASLQDAQVDLNPHQVEAALFAFKSPLSMGAILADEVGLGKTIEAGIILSQKWAERKRRLLIIAPANLRKQWSLELAEKFFLPSLILEKASFDGTIRKGNLNPFNQECIIICSYQFVQAKEPYVRQVAWDLVTIDEAHRLRNVYKPGNKIANTIKMATQHAPKILLTATPLQNSLMELYGLVSIIDDFAFGDLKSFKSQYSRITDATTFDELKARIAPVCKRTLRRDVQEYINYTARIPIVEPFFPTPDEKDLYDGITEYLSQPKLYALPASQRSLMTLILRKLLASSTYATAGTLESLVIRLKALLAAEEARDADSWETEVVANYDDYDDYREEWLEDEDDADEGPSNEPLRPDELEAVRAEINLLQQFYALAQRIEKNSKGEKLLTALNKGFEKLEELGAPRKAIIFTESTRTQVYLKSILDEQGFKGQVVLFNGSNNDSESKALYQRWLQQHAGTDRITGSPTADKRQALVEAFRDEATIMIATEAAAEGINLQFCSLVVNYDLPWNPQRIEQRIGRCHRYGQKFDVVVVNFLNQENAADQRVYQLLDEKFQLFSGVFGASDEVLGAVESGIDFEKRIARIYQDYRSPEKINEAFNRLQEELRPSIEENLDATKRKLLENFDDEVHQKLRVNLEKGRQYLGRYERWLWQFTTYALRHHARFADDHFVLQSNPFPDAPIHTGPYYLLRTDGPSRRTEQHLPPEANVYRVGHPLAQHLLTACKRQHLPVGTVQFQYTHCGRTIAALEPHVGQRGWLRAALLTIRSFEAEEYLLLAAHNEAGEALEPSVAARLFDLAGTETPAPQIPATDEALLQSTLQTLQAGCAAGAEQRNSEYYNEELDKLERWADDRRLSLEKELKDLDAEIKLLKAEARRAASLAQKVAVQRQIKELEHRRTGKRRRLFEAQDEIETRKDELLNQIESRLQQGVELKTLFTLQWLLS